MSFVETIRRARDLLRAEGRISVGVLRREFDLDEDALDELVEELVDVQQVAAREGKVLSWIGAAPAEAPATEPETQSTPEASSEPAAAPQAAEAERRQLTVMFCDLVGSTKLSEALDAEDLREVLHSYQEFCAEIVRRYDGQIAQYLGDGLLVYFGFPQAHEDDPVRALRAGLSILNELPERSGSLTRRHSALGANPLQVRIGVHTGPVVVGPLAAGRESLAIGDTVNIAARLEAVAEPGTLVVSEATRHLVRGIFVLEELGSRALAGLANPVEVYRVRGASGVQSRIELAGHGLASELVGRELELSLLLDRWEEASEGHGQGVMLSGEAGLGKSRLLQAFAERVAEERHSWLECRCSAYHQSSVFHPVIELLGQALIFDADDTPAEKRAKLETTLQGSGLSVPEVMPLFTSLLSIEDGEVEDAEPQSRELHRRQTMEALVGWLFSLAEQQPMILVVEDLHWIDPSTLEVMGMLLEQLPTAPLFLLLTFRPSFEIPWPSRSHLTHHPLQPLTRKQISSLAEHVAGGKPLPRKVLEQIVEKTDGVPLFVEELTKSVIESDLIEESDRIWERSDALPELAIPSTLQDSLTARLDRLGAAKEVAQLASVLGREFSFELLAAVSGTDAASLESALAELADAELLYKRGTPPRAIYTFKHALIQDAAYQSLLKRTRQEFHARTARAFLERFPEIAAAEPESVARHYDEAGQAWEASQHYLRAGERATERSANAEAIDHLSRGVELAASLPDSPGRKRQELRLRVALGVPLVANRGYGSPDVEREYARARELCAEIGDVPELSQALFGLSTYHQTRGDLKVAYDFGRQILGLGERTGERELELVGNLAMGMPRYFQGRPAEAVEHLERAIALYRPAVDRPLGRVYGQDPGVVASYYAPWPLWTIGRIDAALVSAQRAVTLAREAPHAFDQAAALMFKGFTHHRRRERAEVGETAAEVIALAERHGFPLWLGLARIQRGWTRAGEAPPDEVVEDLDGGLSAIVDTGFTLGGPYLLGMLAEAKWKLGRHDEALQQIEIALAVGARQESPFNDPELHRLKAEISLEQRGTAAAGEAEKLLTQALEIARGQGACSLELRTAMSLARLLIGQGHREQARELLAPIHATFTEGFETADLVEAAALLAELG